MALPLMAAAFIAYGASRLVCREPIYRALARRFMEPDPSIPMKPEKAAMTPPDETTPPKSGPAA
jgi:H+/Cl- antiporter ClcA